MSTKPVNVEDYRILAQRRLPKIIFDYLEGGADDEMGMKHNREVFERYRLMPRRLIDVSKRDTGIELFGRHQAAPFMIGPTGLNGALWPKGDILLARAAERAGIPFVLSTASNASIEDVAASSKGDLWFQLYIVQRKLAEQMVRRAEAAGYRGIVVTLDTWVTGWRPRDLAASNFPQLRGHCLANYFTDPVFRSHLGKDPADDLAATIATWARLFGNPLTWDDLPWLRSLTTLPLLVKGICHPDDARRAKDGGVDGIYCSNHGGRQADGGLPALDCLPAVVDAADGLPVLFDSGIRSGADVIKALALGAAAVAVGRPYAYGLAIGGTDGIVHVLRSILAEADLIMAVDGYPTLADLTRNTLRRTCHHD